MAEFLTFVEAKELFDYDPITGFLTHAKNSPDTVSGRKRIKGKKVGTPCSSGQLQVNLPRKKNRFVMAHRVIWLLMTGKSPELSIDHINGDPADNRWCNLREATHTQNLWNTAKRKNNRAGFKGVSSLRGAKNYTAKIQVNGKRMYLGTYPTALEAHEAYCAVSKNFRGEYSSRDSN